LAFKTEDNVPAVSYKKNYFFGIIKSPKKGMSRIPKNTTENESRKSLSLGGNGKREKRLRTAHILMILVAF
jgi:hypothetical protein